MAKGCVLFGVALLTVGFVNCVPFFKPPYAPKSYSPLDAWSNSFSSFPSHANGQTWPNFHNFPLPDSSFDDDSEIISGPELRADESDVVDNKDPFNIGVLASEAAQNSNAGIFFEHSIPFNPFFSTFGGFGFGTKKEPWWKGANVCTDRVEDVETPQNNSDDTEQVDASTDSDLLIKPSQFFSGFQISMNSCVEKHNKHVCKRILREKDMQKTITVTRQCCHGYGRARNADVTTQCEKIEIKTITETAEEMGAKEFVRSAKNNGLDDKLKTNVTIFMPTDSAFTDFSEQMFENNLVVMQVMRQRRAAFSESSGITSKDLILNHLVEGWVSMEDVSNEELLKTNFENSTIRINIFPKGPDSKKTDSPYRFTANCAPILKFNKMTTNGIVHAIDRVLTPVTLNVMDIIRQREDMTILKSILEKTNLIELLEGKAPITIFAPTDKAFERLDLQLRRTLKEGKGCATNILKNHMLDSTFCSAAVITGAKTLTRNLLGEEMSFNRAEPKADSNKTDGEVTDLLGIQDIIVNGQAKIIESDLMGTNGVIHVVDTIMPTETALPISSLMEKKNLTIFKKIVELSGLQNIIDDMNNVTFFVPMDKAFDDSTLKRLVLEDRQALIDNNDQLVDFVKYHIVEPMTRTCDLSESKMMTQSGEELRVNLYSTHALFTNVLNRATVNCARLTHFDDESCGSVMHQVDKILIPPKITLLEYLEQNDKYSKFYELVKAANLTELLSDGNQSYTVLIPKNDVFEEVGDWEQNLSANKDELKNMVKTHIVNDVVCCAGIIPTNWPFVRTIESINNNHLRISRDRRPKIENAGITKCDIIATNGIIHEINDVIVPQRRNNANRHNNQQIHNLEDILF